MGTRGRPRVAERPPVAGAPLDGGPDRAETEGEGADGGEKRRRTAGMGRADRRRIARRAARRRRRSFLRELPVIGIVALLIALLLKTFLVQVFVIPSGSMEETIKIGDRVLVDKITPWFGKQPQRGEVVVFRDPGRWLEPGGTPNHDGVLLHGAKKALTSVGLLPSENEGDLIKRVIGVGGDTVVCCDAKGLITVNGTAIQEPYIAPGNPPSRLPFSVRVPLGRLWVMGDHRDFSADSRYHMTDFGQGTIPVSNVIGRAVVVAWPFTRVHQLPAPHSLSSLPDPPGSPVEAGRRQVLRENPGQSSTGAVPGPVPGEPPLVMGVAGVLPFAGYRWHSRRRRRAAVRRG
jgi:signal peptidase I